MLYDPSAGQEPADDEVFVRYLAHEIAHLWWRGADTTSWEDWLNESFAEFSALMILRERFGEEVFRRRLDDYREASAGLPPIRGIDRSADDAFAALYRKGPVVLADLEASIGSDRLLQYLRASIDGGALTTDAALTTLERIVSPTARRQLDGALAR